MCFGVLFGFVVWFLVGFIFGLVLWIDVLCGDECCNEDDVVVII